MRVIYMYHDREPEHGAVIAGNLPDPAAAFRGYRSLFVTQRPTTKLRSTENSETTDTGTNDDHDGETNAMRPDDVEVLELRNVDVELPVGSQTLYWCKLFKLNDIARKSHVIKVGKIARAK